MGERSKGKSRERLQLIVLALAAIAAWGVAGYFRLVPASAQADATPDAASSTPAAPTATARATATVAASGAPSTSALASAAPAGTATAAATAAPAAKGDASACVSALFAPGTFDQRKPDFSFVCTDPYPRHGITEVQAQVVLGRGSSSGVTEGMREWAGLGWYQLAAYAMFRGHCCAPPPELNWTFDLACPLDEAMEKIEQATTDRDQASLEAAMEEYTRQARCITKLGQASNFGQSALPGAGTNALKTIMGRLGL